MKAKTGAFLPTNTGPGSTQSIGCSVRIGPCFSKLKFSVLYADLSMANLVLISAERPNYGAKLYIIG